MLLSATAAYQLWAPSYDTGPNPLLALEERMVRDFLAAVHARTVVDVGCGTGRSMARYDTPGAQIFGVDDSPEMLAEARKKPGIARGLVLAEASRLPFADQVADLTLCSFALSYFPDLSRSVEELARITKPGGQILISDLHPAATEKGWTRSFRIGSDTFEIEHATHCDTEIFSSCENAQLQILTQNEAGFADPERSIFEAAGKGHVYPMLIGTPAVRVIVCQKV